MAIAYLSLDIYSILNVTIVQRFRIEQHFLIVFYFPIHFVSFRFRLRAIKVTVKKTYC